MLDICGHPWACSNTRVATQGWDIKDWELKLGSGLLFSAISNKTENGPLTAFTTSNDGVGPDNGSRVTLRLKES